MSLPNISRPRSSIDRSQFTRCPTEFHWRRVSSEILNYINTQAVRIAQIGRPKVKAERVAGSHRLPRRISPTIQVLSRPTPATDPTPLPAQGRLCRALLPDLIISNTRTRTRPKIHSPIWPERSVVSWESCSLIPIFPTNTTDTSALQEPSAIESEPRQLRLPRERRKHRVPVALSHYPSYAAPNPWFNPSPSRMNVLKIQRFVANALAAIIAADGEIAQEISSIPAKRDIWPCRCLP